MPAHANKMASLLANELSVVKEIKITRAVQANAVFAIVPERIIPLLQKEFFFYVWDESTFEVRWMTSWDTTESDIIAFVSLIKSLV